MILATLVLMKSMSFELRHDDFISERIISKAGLEYLLNTRDLAGVK